MIKQFSAYRIATQAIPYHVCFKYITKYQVLAIQMNGTHASYLHCVW